MINNLINKEHNMSENIDFCEVCLDDRAYTIKEEETIEYARGKEIKYIKKQAYCTECHNPMYIGKINDENLEVLYSKIREVDNIINIEQIKEILEKYSIGKRPLSSLLGWGELTITRYLDGDIPTKSYSDTLKLILEDVNKMSEILENNKSKISEVAYRKCRNRIEELKKSELAISADESNENKIDNVAINIIRKCGEITPLALQKLLYYSQAFYKLFTGDYLFDNDCEAWIHGPVYKCIYDRYKCFGRGQIEINDSDEILLDEIEDYIVGCVVRYFGCYSGKILEEMTHSEMPWILTRRGLKKDVGCNRIIEKEFIDTYFKNVKDKYKLISIDDIKEYSTTLFNSIN